MKWRNVVLFLAIIMGVLNLGDLYGKQYDFVVTPEHYSVFVGGIGSGKSQGGAARAIAASFGYIGNEKVLKTPNVGVITAPTYTILRDATLRTFKELSGDLIDHRRSAYSPPPRVQMRNGSEILFRSTDNPDRLRGPNITWWWGDEAALSSTETWDIMIGRLRQHGQFGYAWLTTTPRGRNWIWKKFFKENRAAYRWYQVATRENPFLNEEFIASLEENYDGDYAAQELRGEFVGFEGLIYPEFDRSTHIIAAKNVPTAFKEVIAGVDWGFVNPGVIGVYGITTDDRLIEVHEEYTRKRGIDEWADVALQLRDIWGIKRFVCDPSEPDYIAKFVAKGCKAIAANNTVSTGIQAVKRRLAKRADGKPGIMYYPGAVNNFAEKEEYQWAKKGDQSLDVPSKHSDHAQDVERYVIMAIDQPDRKPVDVRVGRWA